MVRQSGYIYLLTNPLFPQYTKIGYTKDLKQRLKAIQSTIVPVRYKLYATYKISVDTHSPDFFIHQLIDRINPKIRFHGNYKGNVYVNEFFKMKAEEVFNVLLCIAKLNNSEENLTLYEQNDCDTRIKEIPFNAEIANKYMAMHGFLECRDINCEKKKCTMTLIAKPSVHEKFKSISNFYGYSGAEMFEILIASLENQALSDGWKPLVSNKVE